MNISDEELMVEYGKGAEWAFELLVERYQKPLINFFYRALLDKMQAEDLAQEVFVGLFRAGRRYQPRAKFTTFLFRIAANVLASEMRKIMRRPRTVPIAEQGAGEDEGTGVEQVEDTGPPVSARVDMSIVTNAIREAVASLPADQETAFTLRTYQGLSYEEIARVMRTPVGTVKSRIARAERALRPKLRGIKDELAQR